MQAQRDATNRNEAIPRTTSAADSHLSIEALLADLAARFVVVEPAEADGMIADALCQVGEALRVDRVILCRLEREGKTPVAIHRWFKAPDPETGFDARGEPASKRAMPDRGNGLAALGTLQFIASGVGSGEAVWFDRVEGLPNELDRATVRREGIRSAVFIPVASVVKGTAVRHALVLATTTSERAWPPATLRHLHLFAQLLASSLERQAALRDLQWALDELAQMCGRSRGAADVARAELGRLQDDLKAEKVQLSRDVRTWRGSRMLAVDSPAARHVLAQIEQVAPTTATVLMLGETGSGKEVFAEALHEMSPRRNKAMIRVNCGAIPTALIESELFGRERGAYTGALSRQIGRFEAAHGSTIFLDEVGELPLEVQVKLLRVLQDRVIERLGSPHPIKVDVRVIAATNRDLEQAVADKTFREDLYYRLNVFPIHVPPLRERIEDIPSLAWAFIDEFALAFGRRVESLSKNSLVALQSYGWPGNVRELRNTVERAVILNSGPLLEIDAPRKTAAIRSRSTRILDVEVEHLRNILTLTGWRIRGRGGAAEMLGMKPTTLESRMTKLGIVRQRPAEPLATTPARHPD